MDKKLIEKAFDDDMSGNKSSLRVNLINQAAANPWRTREEYNEERAKLLDLQERQIEALIAIKKSSWQQTIAFIITIVLAAITVINFINN